jgi:hypothetical protein
VLFGYGFSGGSPFSGGSAAPKAMIVDELTPGGTVNPTPGASSWTDGADFVVIDADGGHIANPSAGQDILDGTLDATLLGVEFVTHAQATGGDSNTGQQYDVNDSGVFVIVVENSNAPEGDRWEVRRYRPIFDAVDPTLITGYAFTPTRAELGGDIIATTESRIPGLEYPGDDGVAGTADDQTVGAAISFEIIDMAANQAAPFGGVSIDNEGNIAFTGVADVSATDADGLATEWTTALYLYTDADNTLHRVVDGGIGGDTVSNGAASLTLGTFTVDRESDSFTGFGLTDGGELGMGVTYRPSGNPAVTQRGSLLLQPAVPGPSCDNGQNCPDVDRSGVVDVLDLNRVLGAFNAADGDANYDVNADIDCSGVVDVLDLNLVLGAFNAAAPSPDCDGL